MDYSIKKDAKPEDTVDRILNILKSIDIPTQSLHTNNEKSCVSFSINITGTEKSTNGKGTSKINALASGYAELMERLQYHFLFKFPGNSYIMSPDEKKFKFDELKNSTVINEMKQLNLSEEFIYKIFTYQNVFFSEKTEEVLKEGECICTPFVSCKTKKIEYLPILSIYINQGTNGLAAGNTYEEACVQGLSEIAERYCAKEILSKQIKLPLIPKKYYENYDKLTSLIKEIEEKGIRITIKDASLNKNLPVVCIIFEDIKNLKNGATIKFGAHPFLPIAIERTLTEFLQGFNIFGENHYKFKFYTNGANVPYEKIIMESAVTKSFFKHSHPFVSKMLSNEKDYNFDKKTWYFDENIDNKKIFNELLKKFFKFSQDVYIRNLSFLDFPTVLIYIPKISVPNILYKEQYENTISLHNWNETFKNEKVLIKNSAAELLKICDFFCDKTSYSYEKIQTFNGTKARHLGFYISLVTKNKKKLKKYLRLIINEQCTQNEVNKENEKLRTYQAYKKYFKLYFANVEKEKIKEIIEKKFSTQIYENIAFNLETIEKNIDSIAITAKELSEKDKDTPLIIKIKETLHESQKNNPPNQDEIVKIIDYKPTLKEKLEMFFYELRY